MMADNIEAIDIENFRFLNFRKFSEDKRKITRKKHLLNIDSKEIYPPEGHLAFLLEEGSDEECSSSDQEDSRDQAELNENVVEEEKLQRKRLYLIGGASHSEEATWSFASNLYVYTFVSTDQDLWIEEMKCHDKTKIHGSKIPAMTKSAGVSVGETLLLWGGLKLESFSPTNELFIIMRKHKGKRRNFQAITYSPNRDGIEDSRFDNVLLQEGEIPCARFGHSLTKINDQNCLMLGGISFPNRDRLSFDCSNNFEHKLVKGDSYHLCIKKDDENFKFSWNKVSIEDDQIRRAFHTASYIPSLNKIIVFGGLTYKDGKPKSRLCLQDMICISFHPTMPMGQKFTIAMEKLPTAVKSVFISGHSAMPSPSQDHIVYVFGGYQQQNSDITTKIEPCSKLYIIDLISKTVLIKAAPDDFATAGHSLLFIDNDSLLINGGSQKAMFLFTKKSLVPDKCALGDECSIDETFVSPIPWIFCEGRCQRWLHMHCIGLKVIPKGQFYCEQCSKSRQLVKRKAVTTGTSNKKAKQKAPAKKQTKNKKE